MEARLELLDHRQLLRCHALVGMVGRLGRCALLAIGGDDYGNRYIRLCAMNERRSYPSGNRGYIRGEKGRMYPHDKRASESPTLCQCGKPLKTEDRGHHVVATYRQFPTAPSNARTVGKSIPSLTPSVKSVEGEGTLGIDS